MDSEKFMTHTLRATPWGGKIARVLAAGLQAVEPFQAVMGNITLDGEEFILGERRYDLAEIGKIYVVGAGKAGLPMTRAVLDVLRERVSRGLVVVKQDHAEGCTQVGPVKIIEAGHPVPDERGLQAAQEMLALLESAAEHDLVIVLISGGGSALLAAPLPGIRLDELKTFTGLMISSGAAIEEINLLRIQLDQLKGGGLAAAAAPAQTASLILSDVVGDRLDMIASGPTVLPAEAGLHPWEIIKKYRLAKQLPSSIESILKEGGSSENHLNLKTSRPPKIPVPYNHIVGNNEIAALAAAAQARREGMASKLLTTSLVGEARQAGLELAGSLRRMALSGQPLARPAMLVAGGETTVTLRGTGVGGRNQELALAAVEALAGLPNIALVTLATDGGDGSSPAAGAVVSGETLERAAAKGLHPGDYLENNDSYTFFSLLEDCLIPGPTRTNVNDLSFLFSF